MINGTLQVNLRHGWGEAKMLLEPSTVDIFRIEWLERVIEMPKTASKDIN